MSRAVLFVTFIFFSLLCFDKSGYLPSQTRWRLHALYTTLVPSPWVFYLQFSKTLNFSSSSWHSPITLREWCLFCQDLQLNFAEHSGCPMPCLGAGGMHSPCFMGCWVALSAAETEECPQDRVTSEGTHGSTVSGTLWLFYFFALNQDMKEPPSCL